MLKRIFFLFLNMHCVALRCVSCFGFFWCGQRFHVMMQPLQASNPLLQGCMLLQSPWFQSRQRPFTPLITPLSLNMVIVLQTVQYLDLDQRMGQFQILTWWCSIEDQRSQKLSGDRTMNTGTKFHDNPLNRYWATSVKTTHVHLMVELGDHQSYWDISSGHHGGLYQIPWKPSNSL